MIASEARGAWSEIEGRLRPYVARRVASADDVDDILQEILVRIHQGLASLRDRERFMECQPRALQKIPADCREAAVSRAAGRNP